MRGLHEASMRGLHEVIRLLSTKCHDLAFYPWTNGIVVDYSSSRR